MAKGKIKVEDSKIQLPQKAMNYLGIKPGDTVILEIKKKHIVEISKA